jgi:hypothetical protein
VSSPSVCLGRVTPTARRGVYLVERDEDRSAPVANEAGMPAEPRLPDSAYADAMKAHLQMTELRVQGLCVRPRALFAGAVVAALVGGEVVEFPAAEWDVEVPVRGCGRRVRVQVKCSGERAGHSALGTKLAATWGSSWNPDLRRTRTFGLSARASTATSSSSPVTEEPTSDADGRSIVRLAAPALCLGIVDGAPQRCALCLA